MLAGVNVFVMKGVYSMPSFSQVKFFSPHRLHLWSTTGLNCWISPVFVIYCVLPLSCVVKGKTRVLRDKLIPCKDTIYRWFKDVYWSVSKAVFPLHGVARLDSIYLYGFPLWTWYLVHFFGVSLQLQVQSLYCRVRWSRGPQQRRTTDDLWQRSLRQPLQPVLYSRTRSLYC